MILAVGVKVTLEKHKRQFSEVWDARVLVAAREILLARPGVTAVEFDAEDDIEVTFAVVLDDAVGDGFIPTTTLVDSLTASGTFHLTYAEDGGWKVQVLTLRFEVTPL